jgi:predicted metal-dependent HD superfamily phosphohydrolase
MNYRLILEQVQNHIELMYRLHPKPALLYHNNRHTEKVVQSATQIANHYELNDRDFFVLVTAAWFHDIGYLDQPDGHEQKGADEAATFLSGLEVSSNDIEAIKNCLMATKLPQDPHNLLEQILCDADLFHFGTDEFEENNKLIRKEVKEIYGEDLSKEEWRIKTIALMQGHQYFTDYCQQLLNAKKQENLEELLSKQHKKETKHTGENEEDLNDEQARASNEITTPQKPSKKDRPDKGIETMFRVSSSNHQRLSDMADNKSHILITVNSIIISVVVSLLLRKLDTNDYLTIPAIILLLVSLVTIVLSILSTRPHIPGGTFTQAELDEKKTNLLFFGNFYKMNLEKYTAGMHNMMNDAEFLYDSLIHDVHSQGVVLGRKYKLLRAAYNIFMFGLIVSVIAFIIASLITVPV